MYKKIINNINSNYFILFYFNQNIITINVVDYFLVHRENDFDYKAIQNNLSNFTLIIYLKIY